MEGERDCWKQLNSRFIWWILKPEDMISASRWWRNSSVTLQIWNYWKYLYGFIWSLCCNCYAGTIVKLCVCVSQIKRIFQRQQQHKRRRKYQLCNKLKRQPWRSLMELCDRIALGGNKNVRLWRTESKNITKEADRCDWLNSGLLTSFWHLSACLTF